MASATAAGSAYATHARAHDPGLHLLLDVRLPAHRRLDLGDDRPARQGLPDRGHCRADDADRRGSPARRRAQPAHRGDEPGGRALRPGVRLRGEPHRPGRPAPDVRLDRGRTRTARASSTTSPSTTSPTCSPSEPDNLDVDGLLRGLYHLADAAVRAAGRRSARAAARQRRRACRGSSKAQQLLADEWGVAADIWSVTSWNELARDAVAAEEWNLLNPGSEPRTAYVADKLRHVDGPVVAVSDYMRGGAVADRPLGAARLPGARRRRLRLRRHPPRRAPLLPHRRRVGGRPGPPGPRRRRRRSRATPSSRPSRTTASTTRPPCAASSKRAGTPEQPSRSLRDLLDQRRSGSSSGEASVSRPRRSAAR